MGETPKTALTHRIILSKSSYVWVDFFLFTDIFTELRAVATSLVIYELCWLSPFKAKYIPQKLLYKVEEAESLKKPIADLLVLLGGDDINRGEQTIPPSTKRRKQGDGAGYIECKPIKRNGKEYKQYWYHWEIWSKGDRIEKKSKYIPKRLVQKVERLETKKAPVREILRVLRNRSKRKR